MSNNISKEEFEREFRQVNASWAYEDAALSDKEKELVYRRLNGEITEEEFKSEISKLK